MAVQIRPVGYDHADAQALIEQVQQEYVVRYGGRDGTRVDPTEFAPPRGLFAVAYEGDEPVAIGGWRRHEPGTYGGLTCERPAEIKRMYDAAAARGRGYARAVLA